MATDMDVDETWVSVVQSATRFSFSLRDTTPYVINQGTAGSCMAIVCTDMVATIHRMCEDIVPWLELSPQIAIDSGFNTPYDFQRLVTELGLERVDTYPYIMGERPAKDWSDSFYKLRKNERFYIHGLEYVSGQIEIIRKLIANFGPGGKRFPIMADMYMRRFMEIEVSQHAANGKNPPFHHFTSSTNKKFKKEVKGSNGKTKGKGKGKRKSTETEGREIKHALLIVGMDIEADKPNDWFCIVKSSYGEDWGDRGFSRVGLEVFESIYVPTYDPKSVESTPENVLEATPRSVRVPVYVSLPMGTINLLSQLVDYGGMHKHLRRLKEIGVDGIKLHCWWGIVERHAPRKYQWDGYWRLFQIANDLQLSIQVVMSFHECTGSGTDDFAIPLPIWVAEVGRRGQDIYFKNQLNRSNREYLCWGVDDVCILEGRTALEVYSDFMSNFRNEFAKFFEGGVISLVEVGLGVNGEPRYPYNRAKDGLQCVGEFQCYNKYMKESLKNMANAQECLFCGEIPETSGFYDSQPHESTFFCDGGSSKSFEGSFFLNWYSQELIKHVDRVLALARCLFEGTPLVIKLPSMSCANELTAGYYSIPGDDLCDEIVDMLKKHNVGLYHTLGETDHSSFASKVMKKARDLLSPISGGNALPYSGKEDFEFLLEKAKDGPYNTFVYNELSPNLLEAQLFKELQQFVTKMHGEINS